MSVINLKDRVITLKVVYYGPASGGKTTSLQYVHRVLDPERQVKLVSLATSGDQTLFFDFLPIDLGTIGGFSTRIQGYTVPGQMRYSRTRRFVLAGADAVVFVANSDPASNGENAESLRDCLENLRANRLDPEEIPFVLQYNKRDLKDATSVPTLRQELLFRPAPEYPSVAIEGEGVFDAFTDAVQQAVARIAEEAGIPGPETARSVDARLRQSRQAAFAAPSEEKPRRLEVEALRSQPMAPEKDEQELLDKAVAASIELSELYAEVSVARRQLEIAVTHATALNRLARRMLRSTTSDHVRIEFLRACLVETSCGRASLLCRDHAHAPLREAALEGLDADPLLRVMGRQASQFLEHLGEAAHIGTKTSSDLMQAIQRIDPSVEWLLIVPVLVHGAIDCGVVLYRCESEPPFHLDTTRHLSSVAALVSLALTRSNRDEEVVRLNRDLEERVRERTKRLCAALDTIHELNVALESRVEARTCELEKANETLRKTDEFLIRAERMSSLACLASGIAHEVNNPMAYIQGNLRTLRSYAKDLQKHFASVEEGLERLAPAEALARVRNEMSNPALRLVREDLESLVSESEEGADRVVRVVQGMRNLAHLKEEEAGLVNVSRCIQDALTVLHPQFDHRVEVRFEVDDHCWVRGYQTLLSQVFLNLIVNSIQAMDGPGRLTIRSFRRPPRLIVDVADSGPGIPATIQGRLFEPFFTTKAVGEGTGLGLYTVYQIVERHGGKISARNIPGGGAVFRVDLPVAESPEEADEEA